MSSAPAAQASGSRSLKILIAILVIVLIGAAAYYAVTMLGGKSPSGRRGVSTKTTEGADAATASTAPRDAEAKRPEPTDAEVKRPVAADARPREAAAPPCEEGTVVEVVSEPAGGKVFLGDKEQPGVTPAKICVPKGTKKGTVRVELDRYKPESYYFRGLKPDQKIELKLTAVVYRILVKTFPKGAEVLVDGKPEPNTTTMSFALDPSVDRVVVKVRKAGYADAEQVVERSSAKWQKQQRYSYLLALVFRMTQTSEPPGDEPAMRPEPRRVEPREEPRRVEPRRVEPREEPRRVEPRRVEPREEPMRVEPREEPMRVEPMRVEPREEPRRVEPMREGPPRTEPMREGPPRTEPMRAGPPRTEPMREGPG